MKRDYCNWIQTHIEQSNSDWLAITLRADSSILNFAGQRQSSLALKTLQEYLTQFLKDYSKKLRRVSDI